MRYRQEPVNLPSISFFNILSTPSEDTGRGISTLADHRICNLSESRRTSIISNSSTVVLRGIERFEILLTVMPSMTAEVSTSLCEYIKMFNSRLCQLILGAGAMHSAGLKNINTKHLAIASQTLSFIIAILPYIRECARRHATGNKPAVGEFDNVKRLLQDQQVSIHEKLIDIMSNRATVHVRNLPRPSI